MLNKYNVLSEILNQNKQYNTSINSQSHLYRHQIYSYYQENEYILKKYLHQTLVKKEKVIIYDTISSISNWIIRNTSSPTNFVSENQHCL